MAKASRFFEQAREFAVLPATIVSPIIEDRSWIGRHGSPSNRYLDLHDRCLAARCKLSQLRFGLIGGRSNNRQPLLGTSAKVGRNAVATILR